MEKAVSVVKEDLAALRTGRANPNMFGRIVIDYYGAPTPLPQMATINIPEAADGGHQALRRQSAAAPSRRRSGTPTSASTRATTARHPGGVPAADRGTPPRNGQDRPRQGRGRQGLHPQHPAQGQGRRWTSWPRTARPARTTSRRAEKELQADHRPVHRAGRRAGQAQGSRVARGLMSTAPASDPARRRGGNHRTAGRQPVPGRPESAGRPSASVCCSARGDRQPAALATVLRDHRRRVVVASIWELAGTLAQSGGIASWSGRRC